MRREYQDHCDLRQPQDPEAFEADYPEHLALAKKIPGIQKMDGRGKLVDRGWKE